MTIHDDNDDSDDNDATTSPTPCVNSRRRWFQQLGRSAVSVVAASSTANMIANQHFGSFVSAGFPEVAVAASLVSSASVCDSTVSVWQKDGRIVYLLGTAHISSTSAQLAGQLVRDTTPGGVFVELDPKRISGSGILAQKVGNDSGNGATDTEEKTAGLTKKSRIIVPQIQFVDVNPNNPYGTPQLLALETSGGGPTAGGGPGSGVVTDAASSSRSTAMTYSPNKNNEGGGINNPIMKAAAAAVGNSIKGMYKQLDSAGFESGEEFVVAIQEGRKLGSDIVLGDRDVEVTLRRVTEGLAKTDIKALLNPDSELEQSLQELVPSNSRMMASMTSGGGGGGNGSGQISSDPMSDEQFRQEFSSFVETMKTKDNVRKIMRQLQKIAPFLYEALVSERDAYMAAGLNGLNELESIVAVVGIAHVEGIEANLSINGWREASPSCSKYR